MTDTPGTTPTRRTVWKFPIDVADRWQPITLPGTGRIIHIAAINATVLAWVEVTTGPANPPTTLTVRVYGTGHRIPPDIHHVGTAVTGPFVWHLYQQNAPH